jgi:hypothetical protein
VALALALAVVRPADAADAAGPATYYIDAQAGDDANPGTREAKAWKTATPAKALALVPGSRILLAGGQRHAGPLELRKQAGAKAAPIVVSSFGPGRAVIDGGTGHGLVIEDCASVRVEGVDVAGAGRKGGSDGCGILVERSRDVTLDGATVSGFRLSGVQVNRSAGVRVLGVRAKENGFAGIQVGPDAWSEDVTIARCVAENNPGDPRNTSNHSGNGIVVGAVRTCLIEECEAMENGWDMPRKGNGPVGIWAWNADGVTIQRCISHHNKTAPGAADGGGFDLDGGVTNSVVQHCLAYQNASGGFYICQYPKAPPFGRNVFRFNVAVDNKMGLMVWAAKGERIGDCDFHNNVVIQRGGGEAFQVWEAEQASNIRVRNNVFVCDQPMVVGLRDGIRFEGNCYWGPGPGGPVMSKEQKSFEEWVKATRQETLDGRVVGIAADPRLAMPGARDALPTDPAKLPGLAWFRLLPGSPCVGRAVPAGARVGRDFWGNPVAATGPRNVGADEGRR